MSDVESNARAGGTVGGMPAGMPEDLAALREILVGPERAQLQDIARRLDQVQQQLGTLPETLRPEIGTLVRDCLREAIAATPELDSVRLNERAGRALRRARHITAAAGVSAVVAIGAGALLLTGRNSRALDQQMQLSAARLRAAVQEAKSQAAGREKDLLEQVSRLEKQLDDTRIEAKRSALNLAKAEAAEKAAQTNLLALQTKLRGNSNHIESADDQVAAFETALKEAVATREDAVAKLAKAQQDAQTAHSQVDELMAHDREVAQQLAALQTKETKSQDDLRKARATPDRTRYALATGYDAALDFLHRHFTDLATTPAAEGVALMGTRLAGAAALTVRTDKQKVLWAELTLALASDSPPAVLADNKALLHEFAALFAPTWQQPDGWLLAAAERAGALPASSKLVHNADAFKITVSRNADGATVVRIEPLQNDVEDQ